MTLVEAGGTTAEKLVGLLPERTATQAKVVGVTGLPGAGKSQIIDQLIEFYKSRASRVGVVAVDPSSPIHGGAILGDRIRWMRHANSDSVMIRSIASRGGLGGLAIAVDGVVNVLAACGCEIILVETLGMGQVGCDIAGVGDVVVNVTAPGLGDEIQMMKSGLMDAVDVMVLNKVDLPGYEETLASLRYEMEHRHLPLVETCAVSGLGIGELVEQIDGVLNTSAKACGWAERKAWLVVERTLALLRGHLAERVKSVRLDRSVDELAHDLARRLVGRVEH